MCCMCCANTGTSSSRRTADSSRRTGSISSMPPSKLTTSLLSLSPSSRPDTSGSKARPERFSSQFIHSFIHSFIHWLHSHAHIELEEEVVCPRERSSHVLQERRGELVSSFLVNQLQLHFNCNCNRKRKSWDASH
jgi:hypothetical protein